MRNRNTVTQLGHDQPQAPFGDPLYIKHASPNYGLIQLFWGLNKKNKKKYIWLFETENGAWTKSCLTAILDYMRIQTKHTGMQIHTFGVQQGSVLGHTNMFNVDKVH